MTEGTEDRMRGDRLALLCFALIFLLGLFSIAQSIAMALGH
jgi:hypothetical protein